MQAAAAARAARAATAARAGRAIFGGKLKGVDNISLSLYIYI